MNQWLQKYFSNVKVQRQLFSTYLVAFSLPILAIGLFLVFNTQKNLKNHYLEQTEAENLRVKSIFFDVTTNIYNISEDLTTNAQLKKMLVKQYKDDSERSFSFDNYTLINNLLARDTSIASIKIYSNNHSIGNYGNFIYLSEEYKTSSWYKKASEIAGIFWITKERTDIYKNSYYELTLYRKIPLIKTKDFAILEITISDNYLKNRIENNTLRSLSIVNQDPIFYSYSRFNKGLPLQAGIDFDVPYYKYTGLCNINGNRYIGSVTTLLPYKSNDKIYIVSFSENALKDVQKITWNYTLIVVLALLLPFVLIFTFIRYFSARVNTLRSAMHQASSGDYNIIDSFQGNDELSETFRDLQVMIHEIQKKEAKIYQTQLKEQKLKNKQQQMEFKMLASQINPHFLYNTLETIRMKAFTAGNREVATAIKLLGKSLRYVLENTGTASTTLEKELSYIKIYLNIQKLRFEDRIYDTFDIQPDLDLSKYQILPLLLQPIVENSISHGLENMDKNGQVLIRIYTKQEDFLCIDIMDNGIGMTELELKQLKENIVNRNIPRTHSIGLYNIHQRITLCYGTEYGMEIQSEKGKGTCVSLKLPLNKLLEE